MVDYLAEDEGFEPPWVAPNGFQDRRVMTTSLILQTQPIQISRL